MLQISSLQQHSNQIETHRHELKDQAKEMQQRYNHVSKRKITS